MAAETIVVGGVHGSGDNCGGGCAWLEGVCMAGGMHGGEACMAGGVHGGGVHGRGGVHALRDTVGQCVGGTHPTGMHSCS